MISPPMNDGDAKCCAGHLLEGGLWDVASKLEQFSYRAKNFSTLHAPHQVAEIVFARQGHESTRAFRFDFVVPRLRQKLLVRRRLA